MFLGFWTIKKTSAWSFNTFGSGGLSLGLISVSGGEIVLNDPAGAATTFYYGGGGGGVSLGLKLPKIGKVQIETSKGAVTGSAGPTAFPSTGQLYITDNFSAAEFTKSDIQGVCAFAEVGGGIIGGGSGIAMFIGVNPLNVPLAISIPGWGAKKLLNSARGLLLMAGANAGIQAQIGGAIYLGYLH